MSASGKGLLQKWIANKAEFLDLLRSQLPNEQSASRSVVSSLPGSIGASRARAITSGERSTQGDADFAFSKQQSQDSFTIRQMLACSMHMGHDAHRMHRTMRPFIFGEREGIHVIDLERSLFYLRKAVALVKDLATRKANFLFVGSSRLTQRSAYDTAMECGSFYVNGPWTQGLISNRKLTLGSSVYLPDVLVVLDAATNQHPLREAYSEGIPAVAICDSDCDVSFIPYPIPANDDSIDSIDLVAQSLGRAIREGKSASRAPDGALYSRLAEEAD